MDGRRRHSGSYAPSDAQSYDYYNQRPQNYSFPTHSDQATFPNHSIQPAIRSPKTSQPTSSRPAHESRLDTQPYARIPPAQPGPRPTRHGSVSGRSPLQRLEGKLDDISKEEKRARIEDAEHRARQNSMTKASADGQQYQGNLPFRGSDRRYSSAPVPAPARNDNQHRDMPSLPYEQQPSSSKGYPARLVAAAALQSPTGNTGHRRRSSAHETMQDHSLVHNHGRNLSYQSGSRDSTSHDRIHRRVPSAQHQLQTDRLGAGAGLKSATMHQAPDPIPPRKVRTGNDEGPAYTIPPQTAAGQNARAVVGFAEAQTVPSPQDDETRDDRHHHKISNIFHKNRQHDRVYQRGPGLQEWRQANIARLTLDDLTTDTPAGTSNRRSSSGPNIPRSYDGSYEEEAKSFRPPLYLKCGPLLRYTGMRQEHLTQPSRKGLTEREFWRGTVMIVTEDDYSSYEAVPVLRIFAQPMDLLAPLPHDFDQDLPPEYVDPIAGQVKLSRTGQPLHVRHVDFLQGGVDISRVENPSGLFDLGRSANTGTHQAESSDGRARQRQGNPSRVRAHDGERSGRYKEVKAARLHCEHGVTFWRFNVEIELGSSQARVAYRINNGPSIGFWVPARNQTMNSMFHSCNGFSLSVDSNEFTGPDPLWREVLNKHQSKPFHVMLGGGDQLYNDAAIRDTTLFKNWLLLKNPEHKHKAEFTKDMQNELELFYLDRYSMWFSQGLFGMANCQIPMVNIWDDHDIIDGYGSYPHRLMSTNVFTGLGAVAFKYYMLFQHQSVVSETQREEPSWLLGASPGPYINELSRSVFMFLGRKVAFLGLDCRTERMRDEVLSQHSYDLIFDRCRKEIVKGVTKHLLVLLGVPIAYPRLNFLENVLTSRVMDPIKAIGRTGLLGGFINKFDGGVEILDDLDDHWTAKHHKPERNWFIQELQELAAEKSVRITILGGDVHLGAVGQFYSNKKLGVAKDRDHRYMPNVVSSAIVNTPPPELMSDVLNKRNKTHHLDAETDENMIPMFEQDVDGRPRNNKHLLPRRNFCTITEYVPGSTPPPSPRPERQATTSQEETPENRRYPSNSMERSVSTNRGSFRPGNLVRRLSGSARNHSASSARDQTRPSTAHDVGSRQQMEDSSHLPPVRPTNTFHRRPTNLSEKAAIKASARGGADANTEGREPGHINLEGGLDISLNMEIDQKDPAGATLPYRLLVPALWYQGTPDINTARFKSRGAALMDRLRGSSGAPEHEQDSDRSSGSSSRSQSPEGWPQRIPVNPRPGEGPARTIGHDGPHDVKQKTTHPMPHQQAAPYVSDTHVPDKRQERAWNIFRTRKRDDRDTGYDTGSSFTGSEFDSGNDEDEGHYEQMPQRRPSIAERVFGYGREGQHEGPYASQQGPHNKPGWKIWK